MIRAYDEAGSVIETHQHTGEFKRGRVSRLRPENGAPKATTALPPTPNRRYFSNPDGLNFLKPIRYELEKIPSPWLRGCMRFCSLDCDGADERPR